MRRGYGRCTVIAIACLCAACSGQRTATLTTCALSGAGVGFVGGAAYGGLEGGGFETKDAAIGAFVGAGGGAVLGAFICALIPAAVEGPNTERAPDPPVAPLPATIRPQEGSKPE